MATPLAPVPRPGLEEVQVVLTARKGQRLAVLTPLALVPGKPKAGEPAVTLTPDARHQTFLGFGGSFTEASAEVLQRLSLPKQELVVQAYFSKEHGLGYQFGRVHMNSCDFSAGNWSCLDKPGDVGLATFSIERYRRAILPLVRRAASVAGGRLKLVASPWSPPAWMKDTGEMCGAHSKLLPEFRRAWALHYVRFAQEFAGQGAPLWAFTVQNEPAARTVPWEACALTAEEERDFIRDHLGPALEVSGLSQSVRLLAWDHNRDGILERAKVIYADAVAARYVWGMAFHWYPDRQGEHHFDNVARVHSLWPEKHLVFTEGCCEATPPGLWETGETYAEHIIRDLNNWTEAWVDWNLILDVFGGPNHMNNFCSAPVLAELATDSVHLQPSYFYIGHFARHILPGSQRVTCTSSCKALEATAFANADGTLAAVVLNRTGKSIDFKLAVGTRMAEAVAPPRSISTFLLLVPED